MNIKGITKLLKPSKKPKAPTLGKGVKMDNNRYYLVWHDYDGTRVEVITLKVRANKRLMELKNRDYGTYIVGLFYGKKLSSGDMIRKKI